MLDSKTDKRARSRISVNLPAKVRSKDTDAEVAAVTRDEPASARLTVETETPARRAMSAIVGRSSPVSAICLLRFAMTRDPLDARFLPEGWPPRPALDRRSFA